MNNEQHPQREVCLVGDFAGKGEEKERWRRTGFRPSFVKLTEKDLLLLSESQRQTTAKEFVHDGASFFQRGYIHYGLQLWREAVRIDPEIDLTECGYDNKTALAIFEIFKDEHNFSSRLKPILNAASDILHQWISSIPSGHLYMISSKFAQNALCAYCGKPNVIKIWPPNGDAVPFYYCKLEESQRQFGGYLIDVKCQICSKVWCIVWDEDPIWG